MTTDIRDRILSDDEADRLYRLYPKLGKDYRKFCPTCQKKGTYLWQGVERICDCQTQLQLHKHYLAAGIGVTYQRLGWDDLQNEADKAWAQSYVNRNLVDRGIGLLLTGLYGVGKTLVANLVLKDLVKAGYHCYATTFASMIEFYTAGWKDDNEKKYFAKKVVNSDILLLDDLGRELRRSTKLSEATFDDVLRTRVQGGRATLITTNMLPDELGQGYGRGALSLIGEVSLEREFEGSDFRRKAAARLLDESLSRETRPVQ